MKIYYVVKKQVEGKEGFFFYENEPKRLQVHCTYDDKEFTELVCSFDPYGCYSDKVAKALLNRKYYIYMDGLMKILRKYVPTKKEIDEVKLQKEMANLFLPPKGYKLV